MTEFRSDFPLPQIPDDLTIPQFLLDDYKHPSSEMRKGYNDVWFIDDATGARHTFGEASCLLLGLSHLLIPE